MWPVEQLGGYKITLITVHVPSPHMRASLGYWHDSRWLKTVEVGCLC